MATIRVLVCTPDDDEYKSEINDKNYEFKKININTISKDDFYAILRDYRPCVIFTIGKCNCSHLNACSFDVQKRWAHKESLDDINIGLIEAIFSSAVIKHPREELAPLVSVVTTAYKSGQKLLRPFHSLQKQTYKNWEWIIWDDSSDKSSTWNLMKFLKSQDYRIRIYRGHGNDGVIGSVKFNSSMLARGKYMVELDHDDIIVDNLLELIVKAGNKYPDAGFFYSDFCELYEGSEANHKYGDFYGNGYGSYECVKWNGKWRYTANSIPINTRTMRHIIGVPNHVRVWRTDIYRQLGGHNPNLSVADDYELLLRTFMKTRFVRIAELGYLQYRNTGGNNFTFLRNSLIQKLSAISNRFHYQAVTNRFQQLELPSEFSGGDVMVWQDPEKFIHPSFEYVYKENHSGLIDVLVTVQDCTKDQLERFISMMNAQTYENFELYIVGDRTPDMEQHMNELINICDKRIKWWNLTSYDRSDPMRIRNYALMLLSKGQYVTYLDIDDDVRGDYLDLLLDDLKCSERDYLIKDDKLLHKGGNKYRYWHDDESNEDFIARWSGSCTSTCEDEDSDEDITGYTM